MSNILYIGPYREFTGMGNAARQYIKALIVSGHNVAIRPIYNIFKPYPENEISSDILQLENHSLASYDVVIQHCYPHQLYYDNRFSKNIGIIHLESTNYYSNITDNINIMDQIIVGSSFVGSVLKRSGNVETDILVIPEPIDLNIIHNYIKEHNKINRDNYSFYTIADLSERKNIYELLYAFILAYDADDGVDLVFKLRDASDANHLISQTIEYEFNKIYSRVKKNSSKKPQIIFGDINYSSILYLHNNNDCYVNISSGESFGYSTLEAMAFNNNIIVNNGIGSEDIVQAGCGLVNASTDATCQDSTRPYYLYNSHHQKWKKPDINDLIKNMNIAKNETPAEKKQRISNQNEAISKLSTEHISELFKSI